ncbi:MAG: hypothetical protein AAGH99_04700 [Planctomycetota bacterium]
MADAEDKPGNDLEAQLDALMKQAREGNADDQAEAESTEEPATAVATEPEPKPDEAAEEAPADLGAQLDELMSKVGQEETTSEAEADAQPEADTETVASTDDVPGTDVIADGPADVEDAFDELQGAFDAVQDVIAEVEDEPTPEPPAEAVVAEANEPTAEAGNENETEAEREQRDDDLAAQLQSLLDEANAEEADSFVSPEELEEASAAPESEPVDEDDELDGDHATVDDVIAQASGEPPTTPEIPEATNAEAAEAEAAPAEDQPLIEQIDSLLAGHAEDAISGEFESVDELLGVDSTAGDNVADPADDLDETEDDDDDLGGDFQSMEDLLAKPDEEPEPTPESAETAAPPPAATREEPAVELDQLDGLFAAPTPPSPSPAPAAAAAEEADPGDAGGFESLDALLTAPEPTEEERDGAPPPAPGKAETADAASTSKSDDTGGWKFTIDVRTLQAAAALLLGWTLWACAMVNKPLGKLPEEIQQTVGWVALAIAGPGVLLIVYGLLLN